MMASEWGHLPRRIALQLHLDVFQRPPTTQETDAFLRQGVNSLADLMEAYRVGMHSAEFLENFVLNNSPRNLARIILSQFFRRNAGNAQELDHIANLFISNSWNGFLVIILSQEEVQSKILAELKLKENLSIAA